MLLLLRVSVENLSGHDLIVCGFVLCTFNLHDQPTKRERVLRKNKLWKTFVIYLFTLRSRWKPRYADAVKMSLSVYSIHPSFSTFNIKVIELCALQIVRSTPSKAFLWISKNFTIVTYNAF